MKYHTGANVDAATAVVRRSCITASLLDCFNLNADLDIVCCELLHHAPVHVKSTAPDDRFKITTADFPFEARVHVAVIGDGLKSCGIRFATNGQITADLNKFVTLKLQFITYKTRRWMIGDIKERFALEVGVEGCDPSVNGRHVYGHVYLASFGRFV